MANPEHLKILKQGVEVWNKWREENPEHGVDLSKADLENLFKGQIADRIESPLERQIFLTSKGYGANLSGINLSGASLWGARLQFVNLSDANLTDADLTRANLRYAQLRNTNLTRTRFYEADLYMSNLRGATLSETNLLRASLVSADLEGAVLESCWIHGASVWGIKVSDETRQKNLNISDPNDPGAPAVAVDDIEIAQFITLLIDNKKIRKIIDTITSKVVLILGRFTDERKAVLDALRDELRKRNYSPLLFDFDKPANRDLTETVSTLAHMARFIIADITEPRCIPHELATIVPTLSVPVKPLLLKGATGEYAMFRDLSKYPWVMSIYRYKNSDELIQSLETKVIAPTEIKAKALIKKKNH
jgi:hypothetical protein